MEPEKFKQEITLEQLLSKLVTPIPKIGLLQNLPLELRKELSIFLSECDYKININLYDEDPLTYEIEIIDTNSTFYIYLEPQTIEYKTKKGRYLGRLAVLHFFYDILYTDFTKINLIKGNNIPMLIINNGKVLERRFEFIYPQDLAIGSYYLKICRGLINVLYDLSGQSASIFIPYIYREKKSTEVSKPIITTKVRGKTLPKKSTLNFL